MIVDALGRSSLHVGSALVFWLEILRGAAMEVYEATVRYNEDKLRSAARTMFLKAWRPFFPWLLPASVVLMTIAAAGSFVSYSRYPQLRPIAVMGTCLVILNLVWGPYAYHRYRQRFATFWRGSALLRVTSDGFTIDFGHRHSSVPWSVVKEVFQDPNSLLLFVARGHAVVIPTDDLPDSIVRSIKEFVSSQSPSR